MQYILLAVTMLILLANVLMGLLRGLNRSLLRLGFVTLSAILAFILAKLLASTLGKLLVPVVQDLLSSDPEMESFVQGNPEVFGSIEAIASMLAAPLLFLICFVVLMIVTFIIYFILRKVLRIKGPKNKGAKLGGGAGVGLAIGLICVLVFVTPVMGYTHLFSRTVSETELLNVSVGEETLVDYNEQYLVPASKTPVAAQIYNALGDSLFSGLSSARWNGQKIKLETEWFAVVHAADSAMQLTKKPVEEYGESESDAIHAIADSVGESALISGLGSKLLSNLAGAWLEDESFIGVKKPAVGDESIEIIFDGLLQVLATTDAEKFKQDLAFFADLIDLMIERGVLAKVTEGAETDDLVAYLVSSGFVDEVKTMMLTNPRMQPVTEAISTAALRLLVRELGDPAQYLEEHEELMEDISATLKGAIVNGELDTEKLTETMNEELKKHNVEIPEEVTEIVAKGLADVFTVEELADPDLTVTDIANRLIDHLGDLPNIDQYIGALPQ